MTNGDDVVDYRDVLNGWRGVEVVHQGRNVTDACWTVEIGNKKRGLQGYSQSAPCRGLRHDDSRKSVLCVER